MRNMKVVKIATDALIPYAGNARTHSEEQIAQIANSINEFGWTNPILVKPDKTVIAGHGRLLAAKKTGIETVPCVVLNDLSDEQCRALVIADNKLALNAGWDLDLLASELAELKNIDFDLSVTGFSDAELNDIFAGLEKEEKSVEDDFDADSAAEEIAEPITKNGDVWILGSHRLMCGDSTLPQDLEKLMGGKKADLIFTDPPYGVSIGDKNKIANEYDKKKGKSGKRIQKNIKNDTLCSNELYQMLKNSFQNAKTNLADCASIYITAVRPIEITQTMKDASLEVRHILIWIKNSPTNSLGRLDYEYQHEYILFTWNKTHKKIMKGKHKTSCWFINRPKESKLHPTMKPVELVENAILNSSEANDIVLDIFGGSGSTLIACEQTSRICRMMEITPIYCDVIVKRWETLTGKKAVLENGRKQKIISKHI